MIDNKQCVMLYCVLRYYNCHNGGAKIVSIHGNEQDALDAANKFKGMLQKRSHHLVVVQQGVLEDVI